MKIPTFFRYIKVQITLFYLIASLVLVGVFGVVLYYSISNTLLEETLTTTTTAVEHAGSYVEVYIDRLKALAQIISHNPDTIDYLSGDESARRENVIALLETALETDDSLESIIIVGKDGQVISNEAALDMTTSSDMMEEPWYRGAVDSDMPVLTSARMQDFSMDKDHWVISVSQEITDNQGNNIGVLLIDIKYEVLETYFDDLNLGDEGAVFIINTLDEVVYHEDTGYFSDPDKKSELLKIASMTGYEKDMEILTHSCDLGNADWTLVGVSSLDGLSVIRRQIIESLLFVGIVLLLLAMGVGTIIASRITKPILDLEDAMANMGETFEPVKLNESGNYEAEQLTSQFNNMLKKISGLMDKISQNERYLREYEIKALHSQINPHFLYNTLDTIVWMAEFGDSDNVIAITKSLASFFRISLSKGEELIPLANEVEHVRQYLFIQQQRYQEKLSYDIAFDKDLSDVKVPKILLQPIVENALYHGIREKEGNGHINIVIERVSDQIIMTITDDGVGYDTTQKASSNKTKLGGVGIKNVSERIELYYGEKDGMTVESIIGSGTIVTIRIPLKN